MLGTILFTPCRLRDLGRASISSPIGWRYSMPPSKDIKYQHRVWHTGRAQRT